MRWARPRPAHLIQKVQEGATDLDESLSFDVARERPT